MLLKRVSGFMAARKCELMVMSVNSLHGGTLGVPDIVGGVSYTAPLDTSVQGTW